MNSNDSFKDAENKQIILQLEVKSAKTINNGKKDFKKILLKTAVGAIACDGHIDDTKNKHFIILKKNLLVFFGALTQY